MNDKMIYDDKNIVVEGISGINQTINQSFGVRGEIITEINLQDILQGVQYRYWLAMLIFSAFILFYVVFNCFVEVKSEKWLWLKPAMDEWSIIPAVFLFIIILSQVIGFKGI